MNLLPILQTGQLIVLCAPHAARDESARLAAELALRGAVNGVCHPAKTAGQADSRMGTDGGRFGAGEGVRAAGEAVHE